jgi:tetratricopeptide (TPR) repeat protein
MGLERELATLLLSIADVGRGNPALGLLADGRRRDALRAARDQVKLNPTLADSYFPLVVVALADAGQWEARHAAEQMLALEPASPRTPLALALTEIARKDYVRAEASVRAAIDLEGPTMVNLETLALALVGRGARTEAIEILAQAAPSDRRGGASLNLWRAWRWYEVVGLGLVAAFVFHLALEAIRTPYEGAVSRLLALCVVLVVAALYLIVRATRRQLQRMSPAARAIASQQESMRQLERLSRLAPHIAVILVVVLALFGAWYVLDAQSRPIITLKAGECFNLPPESAFQEVPPIPCDQRHLVELTGVVAIPSDARDPYPGTEWLRSFGDSICAEVYEHYVGEPYVPTATLRNYPLWPMEAYWAIGIRNIYCTVGNPRGDGMIGSVRDAARYPEGG